MDIYGLLVTLKIFKYCNLLSFIMSVTYVSKLANKLLSSHWPCLISSDGNQVYTSTNIILVLLGMLCN